ncbi:hypothetical protein BHE97_17720 [Aeromicrobium sp. PE09-221]|uniref:CaiB/BaiF CoA transferase family protein n=1 Tax=Aeromicrobium sp. PE09-221 TaxID=1898043 RepID=UPI000B3E9F78|nr:CoA transferase [Aeromicrobium sp. PE09-221]OUZ07337.1 hypothetical protein BHE97_17720 [Aeromicrobium sp. PE09-221]
MSTHEGPLAGTRVLDLSTMIAGPLTASVLADYGADVVKVENPLTGDPMRQFGAERDGEGLYWKSLSRGKKSVALDLRRPRVQALVRSWVRHFDVVVENFRPGTLERWGLAPDALLTSHPGLVVLRVTAYGQDGPYADRAGFGTLAEAMTGVASPAADGRRPLLPDFPLADVMAGQLGATAVLSALRAKDRDGMGDVIDLAIYEAVLKLLEMRILDSDANKDDAPAGSAYGAVAPRGAYRCGDGAWMALSGSTPSVVERLLRTIGGQRLVDDPRFSDNLARVRHATELDALITAWCSERTRDEAVEQLTAAGCAVGPLATVRSMLDDPQVIARDSVPAVDDEHLGTLRMTNVFPRFGVHGCRLPAPGPREVGGHTLDVLSSDLGLDRADLTRELADDHVAPSMKGQR